MVRPTRRVGRRNGRRRGRGRADTEGAGAGVPLALALAVGAALQRPAACACANVRLTELSFPPACASAHHITPAALQRNAGRTRRRTMSLARSPAHPRPKRGAVRTPALLHVRSLRRRTACCAAVRRMGRCCAAAALRRLRQPASASAAARPLDPGAAPRRNARKRRQPQLSRMHSTASGGSCTALARAARCCDA